MNGNKFTCEIFFTCCRFDVCQNAAYKCGVQRSDRSVRLTVKQWLFTEKQFNETFQWNILVRNFSETVLFEREHRHSHGLIMLSSSRRHHADMAYLVLPLSKILFSSYIFFNFLHFFCHISCNHIETYLRPNSQIREDCRVFVLVVARQFSAFSFFWREIMRRPPCLFWHNFFRLIRRFNWNQDKFGEANGKLHHLVSGSIFE